MAHCSGELTDGRTDEGFVLNAPTPLLYTSCSAALGIPDSFEISSSDSPSLGLIPCFALKRTELLTDIYSLIQSFSNCRERKGCTTFDCLHVGDMRLDILYSLVGRSGVRGSSKRLVLLLILL